MPLTRTRRERSLIERATLSSASAFAALIGTSAVVELDGRQHPRADRVNADRDLTRASLALLRHPGQAGLATGSTLRRLSRVAARQLPPAPAALLGMLKGRATAHRLEAATVELLAAAHLSSGGILRLEPSDPLEFADSCLAPMLDLLAAVAAVWSLPIGSTEVLTPTGTLLRTDAGYQPGACDGATDLRAVARIGDRRRGCAVGLGFKRHRAG